MNWSFSRKPPKGRDEPSRLVPYNLADGRFDWENLGRMDLGGIEVALRDLNERLKAIEGPTSTALDIRHEYGDKSA